MFDKGKPIAGRKARYIDDDIRANNEAIEAAVGFGHDFATGSTQTGEHNDGAAKIYAGDTAPTTKEDGIRALNAGDVGKRLWLDTSVTPNVLKVLTAIGTPNTWTATGSLSGLLDEDDMASDSDTLPATQQSVKAYVDGLDAENIKKDGSVAFTDNQSMGNKKLTDLADPNANQDAATKKYVDDSYTDGFDPTSYTGGESITFPNGLIVKFGVVAYDAGGTTTVTFSTAFPNAIMMAMFFPYKSGSNSIAPALSSYSKKAIACKPISSGIAPTHYHWLAIGY